MASPDKSYRVYRDTTDVSVAGETLPAGSVNPKDYDDVLKFSKCSAVDVVDCTIHGGTENCIDMVQGSNYAIRRTTMKSNGGYGAITAKGSIDGLLVMGCTFLDHGKKYDIELGMWDNYWYPGRKPTRSIQLVDLFASDGKPVVVQVWNATRPIVVGGNVKVVKIPWIIWFPYFCFRALQVKLFGK